MHPFLRSSILGAILVLSPIAATAQTYFHVGNIAVDPTAPTTSDAITIAISGDLSSTGSMITGVSHQVVGNVVNITLTAASGPGLDVLVPHIEEVPIGILAAGVYSIVLNGSHILDPTPTEQHQFTVTGDPCDGLTISSVQWSTFTDTSLSLHVYNAGIGFSYPGFVLLNAEGDTLAKEVVDLFAIGAESWHTLQVRPGAVIPAGTFNGTLQLWTGFFSEFVCSWQLPIDLCPAEECITVHPYISNFGDGLVTGDFVWTVNADTGPVANGTFVLINEQQSASAEVCLPPGSYSLTVTTVQASPGGQLMIGVNGTAWTEMVEQEPFPPTSPTHSLQFDVLPGCFDGTNTIEPPSEAQVQLIIRTGAGSVELRDRDGNDLGVVSIHDLVGRAVFQSRLVKDHATIPVPNTGVYLVAVHGRVSRVVVAVP